MRFDPARPVLHRVAILSGAFTLLVVASSHAQKSVDPRPWALERGVSTEVRAGDDFFAYANGGWLKANTIPAGKERWGAREEIFALAHQQVMQLLDAARTASAGSSARKVADYRTAWLNEAAIESKGLTPLRPLLDSINRIEDKSALTQFLGRWVRADVDPLNFGVYQSAHLLGLSVEPSIHGEKQYVAFLVQGGLGLGDREPYLGTEPAAQAVRTKYQAYIGRMMSLAGFDRAEQRAAAVMALETALAETQATHDASARDRNADTVWTRADLARRAPGMDWPLFLSAAGLGKEASFGAWQPTALVGVARLVGSEPVTVWQDYLRFHLLDEHADLLPRTFAEAALAQHSAGVETPTRAARALEATQLAMNDAIARMYSERYFPAEQKARVNKVVANVAAAFRRRVEQATWMSPATKAKALAKLGVLYVGVGYPEHWVSLTDLVIDPADAMGNARRVDDRGYRQTLARLGQPMDTHQWWSNPQTVGAILIFQQNAYDFSAALLQPPKYDAAASDAAAYGAIGAIIGHDISHYIDVLGADYEVNGAMHTWWSADDRSHFEALAAPLVNQFSAYHPFADVSVDGKRSETENVADLAGLSAAFDAYRLTLGAHLADKAYVRQHDREFFLAFAQSFHVKTSDNYMRTQAAADHSPEPYRVATVRNLDAWYEAFGVAQGDKLYLAPAARVRVW